MNVFGVTFTKASIRANTRETSTSINRDMLTLLLGQSSLVGCTRVDGRNVFVDGPSGEHRINLASGLVFDCADNNLKGTVEKFRAGENFPRLAQRTPAAFSRG